MARVIDTLPPKRSPGKRNHTMRQLGMEIDGKLVKPVGSPAKAGCT